MEVAIVRQKRTGPSKWNFTAGSRVMVQVDVYDVLFGVALEGPSRTHNGNRFLVMLDSGIIRYYERPLVSELRFVTTSTEIDESMKSLSGIESDSRAAMFVRWFLIRLRKNFSIFFVFNQRRNDDLVQLRLIKEGKPIDCMGMVIDSDCSMLKVQIIGEDRAVWLYKGDPAFGTVDRQIRKSCKWWSHNGIDDSILNQCDQSSVKARGIIRQSRRQPSEKLNQIETAALDRIEQDLSSSASSSSESEDEFIPDAPLPADTWSKLRARNIHSIELQSNTVL